MMSFTDMMGRTIELKGYPKRIVSVVPSQTELLYDLGLDEEVIGITKFCIHPDEWFRSKKRIGGTKQLHIDAILAMQPDLIIANKEENTKEQIEALAEHCPVWISDIQNLPDALEMIKRVGAITGKENKGLDIAGKISADFEKLRQAGISRKVAYFIWYNPWMSVGHDTFIHDIIGRLGWINVVADKARYPQLTTEEIKNFNPGLVLLSSEPFPFKEKHIEEIKTILPDAEIRLVDGEMFSWYGSRLLYAADYLSRLIA
jgi:ABC-type Fe3+-hydroxamate transport system substrate-binding protein